MYVLYLQYPYPTFPLYEVRVHPVLAVNAAGQVTDWKLTVGLSDPPNH
jgi:hypothetical protein